MAEYVKYRADRQSTIQSVEYTEEMALRAYRAVASGRRPGGGRMRSATGTITTSSNVKDSSNQTREASEDSDDERKPSADTGRDENNSDDQSVESVSDSNDSTDNYSRADYSMLYNVDSNIDVYTED